MNGYRTMMAAVFLSVLLAVPAFAQTSTTGQTGTTTTTTVTSGQTMTPDQNVYGSDDLGYGDHQWVASGFVGSNWGRNSLTSSVDFGGTLSYLYKGAIGAEFLAGFAPRFNLDRLVAGDADVNNYMANVIVAAPIGTIGRFQPFVSGGVGAMTMALNSNAIYPFGTTLGSATTIANLGASNHVFDPNATHFAGDIGVGVMAFLGHWGVRGDVRYFSTLGSVDPTFASTNGPGLTGNGAVSSNGTFKDNSLLNDVKFWRANIGVAVRF